MVIYFEWFMLFKVVGIVGKIVFVIIWIDVFDLVVIEFLCYGVVGEI